MRSNPVGIANPRVTRLTYTANLAAGAQTRGAIDGSFTTRKDGVVGVATLDTGAHFIVMGEVDLTGTMRPVLAKFKQYGTIDPSEIQNMVATFFATETPGLDGLKIDGISIDTIAGANSTTLYRAAPALQSNGADTGVALPGIVQSTASSKGFGNTPGTSKAVLTLDGTGNRLIAVTTTFSATLASL